MKVNSISKNISRLLLPENVIGCSVVTGVILFVLFVPVQFPQTLSSKGLVLPVREWVLTKNTDGQLISQLTDNRAGINRHYDVRQFERGDQAAFNLSPDLFTGAILQKNDTVGLISSGDLKLRLITLRGEMEVAKANLRCSLEGEKQSLIEEAQQQLSYAKTEAQTQKLAFERQKNLFEKNYIPEEEYELSLKQYNLSNINVKIAEAKLEALSTGAKEEYLNYLRAEISKLAGEISVLEEQLSACTVISPLSGCVSRVFSGDTLMVVYENTGFVVHFPAKWPQATSIKTGQPVEFTIKELGEHLRGKVIKKDARIRQIHGKQWMVITAVVSGKNENLMPGMTVSCEVLTGNKGIKDMASEMLTSIIR